MSYPSAFGLDFGLGNGRGLSTVVISRYPHSRSFSVTEQLTIGLNARNLARTQDPPPRSIILVERYNPIFQFCRKRRCRIFILF